MKSVCVCDTVFSLDYVIENIILMDELCLWNEPLIWTGKTIRTNTIGTITPLLADSSLKTDINYWMYQFNFNCAIEKKWIVKSKIFYKEDARYPLTLLLLKGDRQQNNCKNYSYIMLHPFMCSLTFVNILTSTRFV